MKRTDELVQGDRVHTFHGVRTIAETERRTNGIRIDWVSVDYPAPGWDMADPNEQWEVEAPSKLDLAVQRAQELAEYWGTTGVDGREISELFEMFRAAR